MDLTDMGQITAEQMTVIEDSSYPVGSFIQGALITTIVQLPDGSTSVHCRVSTPVDDERGIVAMTLAIETMRHAFAAGWI